MSDRAPAASAEELDLGEIEEAEDAETLDAELDEAGEGGDDGAAEGEDEAEEGDDVAPEPRRGGGAATPRNLRRRAQEAEREAAALRTTVGDLQRRQQEFEARLAQDPNAKARAEAQEAEMLARMGSDEQARYFFQKGRQEFGQVLQNQRAETADQIDRLTYESTARSSPLHQRYAPRVEDTLRTERSMGRSPPRQIIFEWLVGKDVVERAMRAAPGQRRQAAARVRSQTTQPGAARGDAGAGRRAPADSIEATRERLRGRPLW